MAEKILTARVSHKSNIEDQWESSSFIPLKGEMIIYEPDTETSYPRLKIGDGTSLAKDLPFVGGTGGGGGSDADDATDEEILDLLIKNDMLVAVADGDGSILTDESNYILEW